MTVDWGIALGGVLLSGLLTSISPCPLALNIAAISYVGRRVSRTRDVLLSGLLYAAGQTFAYTALAFLILSLMVATTGDRITRFLAYTVHGYIGPVLILVGMVLLGLLTFSFGGTNNEKMQKMVDTLGLWSAFPLGILFALALCPTTAAMFLAVISLSASVGSTLLFPAVYGLTAAMPVIVFAVIIAFQAQRVGRAFQVVTKIDSRLRNATGVLFIILGVWFSLRYVYEIL